MTEEKTGTSRLAAFMAENYAKPVTMDLSEWLSLNPPPAICERKVDGFRVFLFKSGKNILLATRHGRIYSEARHPGLFRRMRPLLDNDSLPDRMILDGEYVAPDKLHLFDVLRLDERDFIQFPLARRKEILTEILRKAGAHEFEVQSVLAQSQAEIMDYMRDNLGKGEEGIVVKNPSAKYGERNAWLKLKRFDTLDAVVTGYERTKEMEKTGIPHSWTIGLYDDNGQLLEMGKVGTYLKEVDPRKIKIGTVVEIQFQQVTDDLKFRHPHIVRVREDKTAKECTTGQIRALAK